MKHEGYPRSAELEIPEDIAVDASGEPDNAEDYTYTGEAEHNGDAYLVLKTQVRHLEKDDRNSNNCKRQ